MFLSIPASTCYDWRARQVSPSRRQREDAELLEMIVKIRTAHEFAGTYGSPRVWLQLRRQEDEDVHGVPATVFQQNATHASPRDVTTGSASAVS